jgi:thiamine-monophosphate kinase
VDKSENKLVAWIAARFPAPPASPPHGVHIGIGDDMAMVATPGDAALATADMLMDGVHFDAAVHSPEQIGRKALAVSLSDCAAMAVQPRYALVSVALPNAWSMEQAQRLYLGMESLAQTFDCAIVGGDTNSWAGLLVIDVTVLAEAHAGITPVRRDGAVPGDGLFVTGKLGGSLRGHHLTFRPRVDEARWLARRLGDALHAMMDLSDGLAADAPRMAAASGCGLVFEAEAIEEVVSDAAVAAASEDGRSAIRHALEDGEDFELLFAAEPGSMSRLMSPSDGSTGSDEAFTCCPACVGVAVQTPGVRLRAADGQETDFAAGGWQHFT